MHFNLELFHVKDYLFEDKWDVSHLDQEYPHRTVDVSGVVLSGELVLLGHILEVTNKCQSVETFSEIGAVSLIMLIVTAMVMVLIMFPILGGQCLLNWFLVNGELNLVIWRVFLNDLCIRFLSSSMSTSLALLSFKISFSLLLGGLFLSFFNLL